MYVLCPISKTRKISLPKCLQIGAHFCAVVMSSGVRTIRPFCIHTEILYASPFSILYVTTKLKTMRIFPQLLRGPEITRLRSLLHKPEKERHTQPPFCMINKVPPLV